MNADFHEYAILIYGRMPTPCWVWLRSVRGSGGYGHFRENGEESSVHRRAYEIQHGAVPPGLTLDHLCRVKRCLNPEHLEAVTVRLNILRAKGFIYLNLLKTACPHGHAYSLRNTYIRSKGGRLCRACGREQKRRKRLRRAS